jgi:hypothetical protein
VRSSVFSRHSSPFQFSNFYTDRLRIADQYHANQYTFIVTTKPASNANQLSSEITLGATASSATVKTTLTNSHINKPAKAALDEPNFICRANALANKAAGNTTAKPPQATDHIHAGRSLHTPTTSAKVAATATCIAKISHGEAVGFFIRQTCASCGVKGLNSGSGASSSSLVEILVISNYTEVTKVGTSKAHDYT